SARNCGASTPPACSRPTSDALGASAAEGGEECAEDGGHHRHRGDHGTEELPRLLGEPAIHLREQPTLEHLEPMIECLEPMIECLELQIERVIRHELRPSADRPVHQVRRLFHSELLLECPANPSVLLVDRQRDLPNVE